MERITPAASLAEYEQAHPEISFAHVPGHHYAWKPEPDDVLSGEVTHGYTEDELLAKLTAASRRRR
jgi:hypothetical protein